MNQYLQLAQHVMFNGAEKSDRTGTGTRSVFGHQMRFNLAEGFPLLTTKRMFTRGMIEELLWFISGSTDVKTLQEKGVHFWDSWVYPDGTIGHGYGKQLRSKEHLAYVKPRIYSAHMPLESRDDRTVFGVGYYGNEDKDDPHRQVLVNTWREMLRRCYHDASATYKGYGGNGVGVCARWHSFANFQQDAKRIPGWFLKLEHPESYSLDKDVLWASNIYSDETCMWASEREQNLNKSNTAPFFATDPDGRRVLIGSIGEGNRIHGLNMSAVHRCLEGKLHSHHGWTEFCRVSSSDGEVVRFREIDQLKSLIAGIKHNPDSRRHMISLWDAGDADRTTLPPCHGSVIQFDVNNGKLSCQMYQRSADVFLGVPVNIASYALLTHMVAQQCGLEVGDFIWTGGDCHIYKNHLEQVSLQLTRAPRSLPLLCFARRPESIFDYKPEDILLAGYDPEPAIKGAVAV